MSRTKTELYRRLGLTKKATAEQVKKAYREKALHYHPDRNPGDDKATKKFQEVQEAYDVLSDAARRRGYDETGEWDEHHNQGPRLDPAVMDFLHQMLAEAFKNLQAHEVNPHTVDFVGSIRGQAVGNLTETRKLRKDLIDKKAKLEKVLGRFKTDNEDNLLEALTKKGISNLETGIKAQDECITVMEKAIAVLSEYKFDPAKPEYDFGFGGFAAAYGDGPIKRAVFKSLKWE